MNYCRFKQHCACPPYVFVLSNISSYMLWPPIVLVDVNTHQDRAFLFFPLFLSFFLSCYFSFAFPFHKAPFTMRLSCRQTTHQQELRKSETEGPIVQYILHVVWQSIANKIGHRMTGQVAYYSRSVLRNTFPKMLRCHEP